MKDFLVVIKNKKKIILSVKETGFFSRGIGLMFRSFKTKNLLFSFKKDVGLSITSFFVFFKFLASWLDDKNNVLEFKVVRPF